MRGRLTKYPVRLQSKHRGRLRHAGAATHERKGARSLLSGSETAQLA
jgi:hypothetical protein